jgi:hypothetical protein
MEMSRNFKYLDELIHSGKRRIRLDCDIILDDEERVDYLHGIKIDVDGLVIDGDDHSIDARQFSRIFSITGKNVKITNLRFTNGYSFSRSKDEETDGVYRNPILPTGYGGAIYNRGEVTLVNCHFRRNNSISYGGAIVNTSEYPLKLVHCYFEDNSGYNGGAIFNRGKMEISRCDFHRNGGQVFVPSYRRLLALDDKFTKYGGAILNESRLEISNSRFYENYARDGGAINNFHGEIRACNVVFYRNASRLSGAINNWEGSIELVNANFRENASKIRFDPDYLNYAYSVTMIDEMDIGYKHVVGALYNKGYLKLLNCGFEKNRGNVNSAYNDEWHECIIENSWFDGRFDDEVGNVENIVNSKFLDE